MNRCNRVSKLLDLARRIPAQEVIDGTVGDGRLVRRTWKKLGGVKLKPGRPCSPERRHRKRRDRAPARTAQARRKDRRGWQD